MINNSKLARSQSSTDTRKSTKNNNMPTVHARTLATYTHNNMPTVHARTLATYTHNMATVPARTCTNENSQERGQTYRRENRCVLRFDLNVVRVGVGRRGRGSLFQAEGPR